MPNYIKQNFENDQILKTEQLNYIEKGIERASKGTSILSPSSTLEDSLVSCSPLENSLMNVTSYIEVTQEKSNNPVSPENILSISNGYDSIKLVRCGKNLLGFNNYEITSSSKVYIDACNNGIFTRTVLSNHTTNSFMLKDTIPYMKNNYFPAGTYIFTVNLSSTGHNFSKENMRIQMELVDGTTVDFFCDKPTIINQSGKIVNFICVQSGTFSKGDVITFTIQLEKYEETATKLELYQGNTYETIFDQTIYGGEYNWTTGLLTVTKEVIILTGSETFGQNSSGSGQFYCEHKKYSGKITDPICTHYVGSATGAYSNVDNTVAVRGTKIWIVDKKYINNVSAFQEYLADQYNEGKPVTIVYDLKEPYTIQFAPQQIEAIKGMNNIIGSTGKTKVSFQKPLIPILEEHSIELEDLNSRIIKLESEVLNIL